MSRNDEYTPVGPFEVLFEEVYELVTGDGEKDKKLMTDGGTATQQEEEREEEVREILHLADQARAEMRKAEQQAGGSRYAELEGDVRQKMGEIEDIVTKNEDEFENVHSDVINAEVSGENLSEVDEEIQQMISNTQNEFQEVERLASKSLEELEEVMRNNQNPMGNDEQIGTNGYATAGARNELLTDVEQRIQKIEELAQQVTKLEVAELEEEKQVIEEEADFEQRYNRNREAIQNIVRLVEDEGQNPQTVEEEVFSDMSTQQLEQLEGDLEYMIQEARDIKQKAEREPEEIEILFSQDEEVLELLRDYIDRSSD